MSKLRVIFVDDDASILDGLQRMLRKQSSEWEMHFVTSGQQALNLLDQDEFDVIVTDMQMPEMTGTELLEKLVQLHPEIGRIVLSGYADEELAVRAIRVAHQFLVKPTDPITLKTAIARARPQRNVMSNDRIRTVVASCQQLPIQPTYCAELTHLLQSDEADSRRVADVISRDVSMSAKVLQLVNSSFFGVGRRISSIEMAVTLLGLMRIRALVLREQIFRVCTMPRVIPHFSIEYIWDESLKVAELARLISKAEGQKEDRPDQAFSAGLLHDIGLLLLACLHEKFEQVIQVVHKDRVPICQAEMEILNVTHAEIGAYLLSLWGLPSRIIEAVASHHHPSDVAYDGLCAVTTTHMADVLTAQTSVPSEEDSIVPLLAPGLDRNYLKRCGLEDRLDHWTKIAQEFGRQQPVLSA